MKKKLLLTGSSGFIGSHLSRKFTLNFEIQWLDLTNGTGDIRDYAKLAARFESFQPDYVCHQAALPSVPDSFKRPEETFLTNTAGTFNIIELCKRYRVKKLVVASSSSVDGNSPYGASKRFIEEAAQFMSVPIVILRYFNVFGPYQQMRAVIPIWINAIKNNLPVQVFGSDLISRDFTYIDNIIRANFEALVSDKTGLYHVGCGRSITLREVYETICLHFNPGHSLYSITDERFGDLATSQSDKSKWIVEPIVQFEDGIKKWSQI